MKQREPISRIMTSQVITLNTSQSLAEAEEIFTKHNIRHIPVVSGTKLKGILSLTDILRISFVESYGDEEHSVDTAVYNILSIEQVMVTNPVTVSPTQTIKEVARILSNKEFHALPVVEDGVLKGIVTTTDLIKYLLAQY